MTGVYITLKSFSIGLKWIFWGVVVCDGSTSTQELGQEEEGACGTLVNKMMMEASIKKRTREPRASSREQR